MPEICTQVQEILAPLRLGHDVEVAPQGYLQLAATEQIDMSCQLTDGATCAFGDGTKFAFVGGEECQDTISFPKVGALEYNGCAGIAAFLAHGEHLSFRPA